MSRARLFAAIEAGDSAETGRLLQADPGLREVKNEKGVSAVLMACYMGRKEIRDLLIAEGAHLELHEAAAAGQLERVRELVGENPALARSYSPDGFPILALAAVFGHRDVLCYLSSKGADINAVATNGSGYTALTGAVASGHAEIAEWLAQNGADVNYRYAKGYSPLLVAAANGHLQILKMLLAHGADVHARSDDGKSALNFAEERNHKEVAEFLKGLTASASA